MPVKSKTWVAGPVVALSTMVIEPFSFPCNVGVKVRDRVHVRPALRTVPAWQGFLPVSETEKSPFVVRLVIVIELVVEFFTVTVLGPRLLPTTTLPNPSFVGWKAKGEAAPPVPVPFKLTICGL